MRHFAGDTVRIEDQIRKSRRDRAARHAVKFGALRCLHDDQAVALLDGADPVRPV